MVKDGPSPQRRRVARSFRAVALGAMVLVAVIGAIGASLYLRYIRYERVAARHVRFILPLLGGPGRPAPEGDARIARIEERTGLRRGDLREILVARGADRSEWVVVLGGIFPRGPDGGVLEAALRAESPAWTPASDGVAVVHEGFGVAVGRATDGAVLIASSERVLRASRAPSATYQALGLAPIGPGSLALSQEGIRELAVWPTVLATGDLPGLLGGIEQMKGVLSLGDRTSLAMLLVDSGAGEALRAIQVSLDAAKALDRSESGPAAALLRAGAERATSSAPSRRTAEVVLVWETEEVSRAFALLAEAIQDRWR